MKSDFDKFVNLCKEFGIPLETEGNAGEKVISIKPDGEKVGGYGNQSAEYRFDKNGKFVEVYLF